MRSVGICCGVMWLLLAMGRCADATPSTTYWTPCTTDIQPAGVTHLGVDDYFRVGAPGALPTDIGPEWGANLSAKIAVEYGFDVLTSSEDPLYANVKVGYRENMLSENAPALELGIFNCGTRSGVTNQNILYIVTGKSLPDGKTGLNAAYYVGNSNVLRSSTGEIQNTGYMVAFTHQLVPGKWVLAGDYASGKNAIGGGGIGVYYYFTKDISLLFGPVWFNDEGINGETKWTTQFDINL
jgi:hypothetical protein